MHVYRALKGFSVNDQKVQSVRIWALHGGGTAHGNMREPMVSPRFLAVWERSQQCFQETVDAPAEGAVGGGQGEMLKMHVS